MSNTIEKLIAGLMLAVLFVNGFNIYQMQSMKPMGNSNTQAIETSGIMAAEASSSVDILPKGTPRIYGAELSISYDDVSASNQQKAEATIRKLGLLDNSIKLNEKEKERYIAIASQISCEYCCGVESIIFNDGSAACSCSHSFAMRGVAKYLIKNHPNEFTNDEILEELGKWKTLFFPSQLSQKAKVLQAKGIEINYINLASNKYRKL